MEEIDPKMNSFDKLMLLNHELFLMIENEISLDLLAQLYSSQLITRGEKHLLDHNRTYYRLRRQLVLEGQSRGELSADFSANDIVRTYALCERALLYDWCIFGGAYSLHQYSDQMMPQFMARYKKT